MLSKKFKSNFFIFYMSRFTYPGTHCIYYYIPIIMYY
jgi:hypothetical protein